jgi:hypothetical protein
MELNMMRHAVLVTCVVVVASAGEVRAGQDPPTPASQTSQQTTQELRLRDGSVFYGVVTLSEPDRIDFRTISGAEIRVDRSEIVSIKEARGETVAGEFRPSDPNATRLLFAPTGRSLGQGEGYFGMYQFLMPFVQVGITDRISLGGGTPLMFGFDEGTRPFWLTPKVQIVNRRELQAAAGVMHIVAPEAGSIGIAYGVVTIGRREAAVTAGVGAGYRRYEGDNSATAIFMIGGERGLRRGMKFVTENYIWNGFDGILSGAIRFYGERLSADVGVFSPLGFADGLYVLPLINVVWTF